MSRLRHSTTTFAVLALLVAVPALVTAPVVAQENEDEPHHRVELFIFANDMTNPDDDNDGRPDVRWQVRLTVTALGGCVPTRGERFYDSFWLDAGEEVAARLAPTACVFRFSARARVDSRPGCEYRAQIAWTDDNDNVVGDYHDGSTLSSSRPDDESRLSIRRDPDRGCSRPHRTYFVLGGDSVVEELPGALSDADLLARARRAAAVGEYTVRVEPDTPDTRATGCSIGGEFTLNGDQSTSAQMLGATGEQCPSRAMIVAAPAYVRLAGGRHVSFDAALPNIIVDLTSLVSVEASRIAIIQDVVGSANRGVVTYTITRTCGGEALASRVAQVGSSELLEGRFTVHSPDAPRFGPVGIYPAVATTRNSFTVVGCAVTVTVSRVPAGCTVAGGNTQTLAWSAANPVANFDFEFDIGCGGSAPPTIAPPPADDSSETSTGDVSSAVESTAAGVRIVARKVESGNIQFGLQQRRHDGTWGERRVPREGLFPNDAEVGIWLVSSPLTVSVGESADALAEDVELRIVARRASDGRVEFALQKRLEGGAWGNRQVPERHVFPAGARVDRWLGSSAMTLDG